MFGRRTVFGFAAGAALIAATCTGGDDHATPTSEDAPNGAGDAPSATATASCTPLPTAAPVDPAQARHLAEERDGERTQQFLDRDYPQNNYGIAVVGLHEIFPVLPRDGIQSIDAPNFDTVEAAGEWLADQEPVVTFELNGDVCVYPLQIFTWHEIVNDVGRGEPVIVTYCPLCNTAIAFSRVVDGAVREFEVSGALRRNGLIMYDRETETWWQQITDEAIVGEGSGTQLDFLVSQIISSADFRDSFPDGQVLNRDTGRRASYGENPYPLYDALGSRTIFPLDEFEDMQLDAKERVLAVNLGEDPIAFTFSALSESIVLTRESAEQPVVAFWQPDAVSALDESFIIAGRNIGAAGAFISAIDGAPATFEVRDGVIVDTGTGNEWNVPDRAISGPLVGTQLDPVVSANHF
jgi:hypothetical protein